MSKKWTEIIKYRKIKWKLAYQKEILSKENIGLLLNFKALFDKINSLLKNELKQNINFIIDLPYLDVRPENPFMTIQASEKILILDSITKKIDNEGLLNLFEFLPSKLILIRIFSHKEHILTVNKICRKIFESSNFNIQTTSY